MKKIFGGCNLTWKMLVLSAIIIGVSVGLLNSVPFLYNTTITDIATYFDFWIFCGIFIIMNAKSNKDSALKCFVFFLISQPLIYLVEVPFSRLGWGLFGYYKYWFIWTIFTIPMGYIGYYIKKNKWYGLLILTPILLLLSTSVGTSLGDLIYAFPHHLINFLFVVITLIIYPLALFDDKRIKYVGLGISIVLLLLFGIQPLINKPVYNTSIKCSSEKLYFDNTYKVFLNNPKLGDLYIEYEEDIEDYCIRAKFYHAGEGLVILEDSNGNKNEYRIVVDKNTYDFYYDE